MPWRLFKRWPFCLFHKQSPRNGCPDYPWSQKRVPQFADCSCHLTTLLPILKSPISHIRLAHHDRSHTTADSLTFPYGRLQHTILHSDHTILPIIWNPRPPNLSRLVFPVTHLLSSSYHPCHTLTLHDSPALNPLALNSIRASEQYLLRPTVIRLSRALTQLPGLYAACLPTMIMNGSFTTKFIREFL